MDCRLMCSALDRTKVLLRAFTLSTEAISSFSYRNSRSWIVCPVAPLRTETSISSTT